MKQSTKSMRRPRILISTGKITRFYILGLILIAMILAGCGSEILATSEKTLEIIPSPTSGMVNTSPTTPSETPPPPEPALPPADIPQNNEKTEIESEGVFAAVGVGAADHLDLHSAPSADSPTLAAIPPDAVNLELTGEVQVDPAGDIWVPIEYQGQAGWVQRANLARQAGIPQPGLAKAAMLAIQDLKRQDFPKLAALVHPERGLRFSPYAYIRPEDQVFNANEVYYILADSRIFSWGTQDGSGEAIELSFPDYYQRYIFDVDFSHPEAIGFDASLSGGSRINNLSENYPDAVQVEYYFSGFDPQYGGMDWRSLRLVFAPHGEGWALVGIVHDEWGP